MDQQHIPALPFGARRGGMDSETTSSRRKTTVAPDIVMPDKADSVAESGEAVTTPKSTWLQSLPFTQPIPPALIQAVIKEMASANSAYARTCGDLPPGWKEVQPASFWVHNYMFLGRCPGPFGWKHCDTLKRPVLAALPWAQQGVQGAQTTAGLQTYPATSRFPLEESAQWMR
jgi:hypothetical protein